MHAGDIGDLQVLEQLRGRGRGSAVRGNIDERAHDVPHPADIQLMQDET